jgi:hypothetical protein
LFVFNGLGAVSFRGFLAWRWLPSQELTDSQRSASKRDVFSTSD